MCEPAVNKTSKLLGWLILLLSACPTSANERVAHALYDLSFWGVRIAAIEDSVSVSTDHKYEIHSVLKFTGILAWLGLEGMERTSLGYIDTENARIHVKTYLQRSFRESFGFNIDLNKNSIENIHDGVVYEIHTLDTANPYQIHDSLTFTYKYYLLGGRAADFEEFLFMDGKRTRIYEFWRIADAEKMLYDGKKYATVRYDRKKRGELHTSILYVPEFHWLPGLAVVHFANNFSIQAQLVNYAVETL